jgi:hypothetical protein
MAVTSPAATAGYIPAPRTGAARVHHWRRRLLVALVIGCLAAAGMGLVVLIANQVVYDRYDALVYHGSTSVDAALDARADVLDNAAANASVLMAQTADARNQAQSEASQTWSRFQNDMRRSWQNLSDPVHGETASFQAADTAGTQYNQWIGAMNAALSANPPRTDDARAAFLQANTVLEQQLLPALTTGLEDLKLEDMGAAYASTSSTIRGWLFGLIAISVVLLVVAGAGYFATLRMHRRFTVELVLAIVIVVAAGSWVGLQLHRADTQAKVMVKDAYNTVAGVRDEIALVSQQHERESIALIDTQGAAGHAEAFQELRLQVEKGLCGFGNCTARSFLAPGKSDTIDPAVVDAAVQGQSACGLARPPLVANVHFPGEAAALERARQQYRAYLTADQAAGNANGCVNTTSATTLRPGQGTQAYNATVQQLDAAGGAARRVFESISDSVQSATRIGEWLAAAVVVAALLLARGLWRRRAELFPSHGE